MAKKKYTYVLRLMFKSDDERVCFRGQLSDGWGENLCAATPTEELENVVEVDCNPEDLKQFLASKARTGNRLRKSNG